MAVNETLLHRVCEALIDVTNVEEKKMFGGICFMVDDKMCICVRREDLLVRLNPDNYEPELEKNGVEQMVHGKRVMPGYVYVGGEAIKSQANFMHWINIALEYNPIAQSSKAKNNAA